MDAVDIEVVAGETFVFTRGLANWAALYPDIGSAVFRSYMRLSVDDPNVWYSWASDGSERGSILFTPTPSVGLFNFSTNPTAGDQIQLGTTLVQFVASGASGNQVNLGTTLEATLVALKTFLSGSNDSQISQCSYSLSGYSVLAVFKSTSLAGNSFVIGAPIGTAVSPSGPTLSGGGGNIIMTTQKPSDTAGFSGQSYVYDLRMELDGQIVYLFGGNMMFLTPVTR